MSLQIVQNARADTYKCGVPEARAFAESEQLQGHQRHLENDPRRSGLAGGGGCARGAYEHTVAYAQTRQQFSRPIRLVSARARDDRAHAAGQLTAMQSMVYRLSQLQDEGRLLDEHASLAKVFCTSGCREVVSRARRSSMEEWNFVVLRVWRDSWPMRRRCIRMRGQSR